MALQKQTVSLNMGKGLDQKDDDKISSPNTYRDLKDWVFNKFGRLDKRQGFTRLSTTVSSSFSKPITIGSASIKPSIFSHEKQLLLQDKGSLFSWSKDQSSWIFKANYAPLKIDSKSIVSDERQLSAPTSALVNGKMIYVYTGTEVVNGLTINSLRYSVYEESTGNYLVDDVQISGGVPPADFGYAQVIAFGASAFIVWQDGILGNNVKIAQVNVTTGAIGAASVLFSDAAAYSYNSATAEAEPGITHVVGNKSGVGERAFVCYYTTGGAYKVVPLLNTGAIDGAMTAFTVTLSAKRGMALHYESTSGNLFLILGITTGIQYLVLDISSGSITQLFSTLAYASSEKIKTMIIGQDPAVAGQAYVVWDLYKQNYYSGTLVEEPSMSKMLVSASAVVTPAAVIGRGLYIQAGAILDSNRKTLYIPCVNYSATQQTNLLVDLLYGKDEAAHYIQGKWNYGINAPSYSPVPARISQLASGAYHFASPRKTRIAGVQGGLTPSETTSLVPAFQIGVSRNIINTSTEFSASREYLGSATLLSGGYVGSYDGSSFNEQGFFIDPEYIDLSTISTEDKIALSIIQNGSGSQPEIFRATFLAAKAIPYGSQLGPTNGCWAFGIYTGGSPNNVAVIWYDIAGQGTQPTYTVVGHTSYYVKVTLVGNETAAEVMQKTIDAIEAHATVGPSVITSQQAGASAIIQSTTNSALHDADGSFFDIPTSPSNFPDAGAHQYAAVWYWVDVNGQVVRSAPSIAKSVTSLSQPIAVTVSAPPITNRDVSSVRVEIYRTKSAGTTFFRLLSYSVDPTWDLSTNKVSFLDVYSDAVLEAGEFLYTNGGILKNWQPPAITSMTAFKNRIVFAGPDKTSIFYSKVNIPGSPVEFSSELYFSITNDSQDITALSALDDKLVIFKTQSIVAVAGDGANELGVGVSFSQPQTVASDVGCINQNSVQVFPGGLLFKSSKGIYLLDRGLNLKYIGDTVQDYNQYNVARTQLLKDSNEVRFILDGSDNALVYNYHKSTWAVFTNYGGTDACVWDGSFVHCDSDGYVYAETAGQWVDIEAAPVSYSPVTDSVWMKISGQQDFQRIYRLMVLGDLKSSHLVNFKLYYDYDETNFDEYLFYSSSIGGPYYNDSVYQPEIHLKRQKCESMRVLMTVIPTGGTEESLSLVDMSFQVGLKSGLMKNKAGKKI